MTAKKEKNKSKHQLIRKALSKKVVFKLLYERRIGEEHVISGKGNIPGRTNWLFKCLAVRIRDFREETEREMVFIYLSNIYCVYSCQTFSRNWEENFSSKELPE